MVARIIFLSAVIAAIVIVLLLALFSPVPQNDPLEKLISLSLYVQQPHVITPNTNQRHHQQQVEVSSEVGGGGALIFHRMLTEGPENTSRVVGRAQGFIIPHERFAKSDFNMIYLTFETPGFSGSVSVQAKDMKHKEEEILDVVGGTGAFAFARGIAVFAQTDHRDAGVSYRVKLQLRFPDRSHTIPG